VGFVNEGQLQVPGERDAGAALLQMWLDAGMTLGNHSFSHSDFNDLSAAEFENEVVRGDVITRQLRQAQGVQPLFFRFPFNHTGKTKESKGALETFLKSRHYICAPFTIEHSDYMFNQVWLAALKTKDATLAQRIRAAYLECLDPAFNYAERRSKAMFGGEIRQVFLIHANELNADCLDEMIGLLRKRGYSFITLEQAMQDKGYQTRDDYVGEYGISWLHRWAVSMGMKSDLANEPDPPKFILDLWHTKN
jgi:peptidoglycan/xylan/chitin deacetylase (PgdA/CDA1 family)